MGLGVVGECVVGRVVGLVGVVVGWWCWGLGGWYVLCCFGVWGGWWMVVVYVVDIIEGGEGLGLVWRVN